MLYTILVVLLTIDSLILIAAVLSLLVGRRIGFPIFSVVANASFTKELLMSMSR